MAVASRVALYRKSTGLSQAAFARRLGVSRSFLGNIESGRNEPSFNFLMSLMAATEVRLPWVLTDTGPMVLDSDRMKQATEVLNIHDETAIALGEDGHTQAEREASVALIRKQAEVLYELVVDGDQADGLIPAEAAPPLSTATLAEALALVQQGLADARRKMAPDQQAQLVAAVYELLSERPDSQAMVRRLVA